MNAERKKKPFMFTSPHTRSGFKLVVFATSLQSARNYVTSHKSREHRALRFLKAGEPTDPSGWTAAIAPDTQ